MALLIEKSEITRAAWDGVAETPLPSIWRVSVRPDRTSPRIDLPVFDHDPTDQEVLDALNDVTGGEGTDLVAGTKADAEARLRLRVTDFAVFKIWRDEANEPARAESAPFLAAVDAFLDTLYNRARQAAVDYDSAT